MKRVVVQNCFLEGVAAVLQEGRSVRVRIDGRSMHPFIRGAKDEVELVPYHSGTPLPLWCGVFFCWKGDYMVHRYIGKEGNNYCFMGDGNLVQIEKVEEADILGVLRTIFHSDGTTQDCFDPKWLQKGAFWYRFRWIRRFWLPFYRRFLA